MDESIDLNKGEKLNNYFLYSTIWDGTYFLI